MAEVIIEVAEPGDTDDPGKWRWLEMEHSIDGRKLARQFLYALPTARVEQTAAGYRVWAMACDPAPPPEDD